MYLQYSFLLEIKVFRRKIGRESVGVIYLSPPVVDGPGQLGCRLGHVGHAGQVDEVALGDSDGGRETAGTETYLGIKLLPAGDDGS